MVESCEYCLSMPLAKETTDKQILEQYVKHPHLYPVKTNVEWHEAISTLLCLECKTVFTEYSYDDMEDENEENIIYSFYRLPNSPFSSEGLRAAGTFLYYQREVAEWNLRKINSEYIDIYAMLDVNTLSQIQNGNQVSTLDQQVEMYESLPHLLHKFWLLRAGACHRYYVKLSVPISTIEPIWNPETGGLGSGHGGFVMHCSHHLSAREVEVFDITLKSFVLLSEWNIPPVYEQDSPEVDKMFEVYRELEEKTKEKYNEFVKERNEKIDIFIKDTYEIEPTT